MMGNQLRRCTLSEDLFNDVLLKFRDDVYITDNIYQYFKGYQDKWKIMYDGREYLICREFLIEEDAPNTWKQSIYRKDNNLKSRSIVGEVTGTYGWNYINNIVLKKHYTQDEIKELLYAHEAEYSDDLKQQHYNYIHGDDDVVYRHKNCYKYDINGAHNDALRIIFPKASKDLEKLYLNRKVNPNYKKFVNFYVGNLARRGFRKTYNWIVQRTTRMLEDAEKKVGGVLIYSNTDGFLVSNPKINLDAKANVLGEFKLEFSGDAYTYQNHKKNDYSPYYVIQTNEIKGTLPLELREHIDLSVGKVVDYKRIAVKNEEGNNLTYKIIELNNKIVEVHDEN